MANQYKGEVALEAGGATYRLDLTANAIIEIEDRFKNNIGAIQITGDIRGSTDNAGNGAVLSINTPALITARGQITQGVSTDIAITSLAVKGTVRFANILAGYDITNDANNFPSPSNPDAA